MIAQGRPGNLEVAYNEQDATLTTKASDLSTDLDQIDDGLDTKLPSVRTMTR